jgi:hypothetical protein
MCRHAHGANREDVADRSKHPVHLRQPLHKPPAAPSAPTASDCSTSLAAAGSA